MGLPKQLLDWYGRPLIRAVTEHLLATQLNQLYIVVGYQKEAAMAAIDGLPVHIVANPDYAEGQSSSLRTGISALGPAFEAAMILLVDQPFVTATVIDRLIEEWRAGNAPIVAPRYKGQYSPPVLFSRAVFAELLALTGDQGARRVLLADPTRVQSVPFDQHVLADIDTPDDYERLRAYSPTPRTATGPKPR